MGKVNKNENVILAEIEVLQTRILNLDSREERMNLRDNIIRLRRRLHKYKNLLSTNVYLDAPVNLYTNRGYMDVLHGVKL